MRHGRSAVALASLLSLFGLGPPASAQRAPRGRVRLSLPGLPPPSPAPATPPAPAPPPAPTGAIPPGYEYFEVIDLTTTFRDDDFLSVTVDPKDANIAYVGTFQGRVYRTSDRGRTWNEAILIPELKEIWGFAGQPILFGHIRNDLAFKEDYLDLAPHMTQPPAAAPNLASRPNYQHPPGQADPLAFQSTLSSGNAAEVLGVGLSLRAPRLSLFVSSRGRPVPRLSFQKLLQDRGVRGTWILRIFVNPGDTKILFASTLFGLYKSYDRGVSWVRTFAGSTLEERTILGIGFDPEDPMHVLLGTSAGVYGSSDGGENWTKVTTIPDVSANEIIFDVTDPRFIYIGAGGGVFRSDDGGKNFVPIYYSTLPARSNVQALKIDPFDPNTGYIGTADGIFVSQQLRTGTVPDVWSPLAGLRTGDLTIPWLGVCKRHRGHLYAMTRADLWTINYGADGPESALLESWDGGQNWRGLFKGNTMGSATSFWVDPHDTDQVWLTFNRSVQRLERIAQPGRAAAGAVLEGLGTDHPDPPMSDVLLAALRYHGVELADYLEMIEKAQSSNWVPRAIEVTYERWVANIAGRLDDIQFGRPKELLNYGEYEWRIMTWASWSLPLTVYSPDSVPMLRTRVLTMNDELRGRIIATIHRNYGELLRIKERLRRAPPDDVYTRTIYRLRIEQLEALVDLESGGYLTRRKNAREKEIP